MSGDDKRVSRIDSPDGRSSLFCMSVRPGGDVASELTKSLVELQMEVLWDVARRKGVAGVPGLEETLRERAVEFAAKMAREARARGISPQLMQLLGTSSKREAERLAKNMVITHAEFADLVFNAHALLGYRHRMKWKEFVPDHLRGASEDVSGAFAEAKPGPATEDVASAMRKVHAIFEERKRVHAHMFERGTKWHCFFFDFNDLTDPNLGPHIHYLSHRWAEVKREQVWASFDDRRQSIPRGLHIRYSEEKLEEAARRRRQSQGRKKARRGYVLRADGHSTTYVMLDDE